MTVEWQYGLAILTANLHTVWKSTRLCRIRSQTTVMWNFVKFNFIGLNTRLSHKALIYLEKSTTVMSFRTKSDQNKVRLELISEIQNILPKCTFQKCSLQLVNRFKLLLVPGDYVISQCALWPHHLLNACIWSICMHFACKKEVVA